MQTAGWFRAGIFSCDLSEKPYEHRWGHTTKAAHWLCDFRGPEVTQRSCPISPLNSSQVHPEVEICQLCFYFSRPQVCHKPWFVHELQVVLRPPMWSGLLGWTPPGPAPALGKVTWMQKSVKGGISVNPIKLFSKELAWLLAKRGFDGFSDTFKEDSCY